MRTLMDSSSVRNGIALRIPELQNSSRREHASTWSVRANRIAHGQYAPRISTAAATAMRARCEVFTAIMDSSLSAVPLGCHSIEKIQDRSPLRSECQTQGARLATGELAASVSTGGASLRESGQSIFPWREEVFLPREAARRCAGGFAFAEAAREKALELLFRRAPGDHSVQFFVNARFDQQRGFDGNRMRIPRASGLELA